MLAYLSHSSSCCSQTVPDLENAIIYYMHSSLNHKTSLWTPLCEQISSNIEYFLFPGQNIIATTYPAKDPKTCLKDMKAMQQYVHKTLNPITSNARIHIWPPENATYIACTFVSMAGIRNWHCKLYCIFIWTVNSFILVTMATTGFFQQVLTTLTSWWVSFPDYSIPFQCHTHNGYTNCSFHRCLWKAEGVATRASSKLENSLNIDTTIGMTWILESMQSNCIHYSLEHSPISNYNSTHICTAV